MQLQRATAFLKQKTDAFLTKNYSCKATQEITKCALLLCLKSLKARKESELCKGKLVRKMYFSLITLAECFVMKNLLPQNLVKLLGIKTEKQGHNTAAGALRRMWIILEPNE